MGRSSQCVHLRPIVAEVQVALYWPISFRSPGSAGTRSSAWKQVPMRHSSRHTICIAARLCGFRSIRKLHFRSAQPLHGALARRRSGLIRDRAGLQRKRPVHKIIGGLWGNTGFQWLFTQLLLVPESLRGRGLGADLMRRAEAEAVSRGCHGAWLDTFEFQARSFYERIGYECFGQLPDYPPGFSRFFMKKSLLPTVD